MVVPIMLEQTLYQIDCQDCAECCKDKPKVLVLPNEIPAIERRSGSSAPEFLTTDDSEKLFYLQNKADGSCVFLEENGKYSCAIYDETNDIRPERCKHFPLESEVNYCILSYLYNA